MPLRLRTGVNTQVRPPPANTYKFKGRGTTQQYALPVLIYPLAPPEDTASEFDATFLEESRHSTLRKHHSFYFVGLGPTSIHTNMYPKGISENN